MSKVVFELYEHMVDSGLVYARYENEADAIAAKNFLQGQGEESVAIREVEVFGSFGESLWWVVGVDLATGDIIDASQQLCPENTEPLVIDGRGDEPEPDWPYYGKIVVIACGKTQNEAIIAAQEFRKSVPNNSSRSRA